MVTAKEKPIKILNHSRLYWLMQGCRAHADGLVQDANPYPPEEHESEPFTWWLFGWTYAQHSMLERN
jgi:hypothetical protein